MACGRPIGMKMTANAVLMCVGRAALVRCSVPWPAGPARTDDVKLVRYADDFMALAKEMKPETVGFIEPRLQSKFQLEINRDKTRVVDLRQQRASGDFQGYTYTSGPKR
jgi:hypothetical protein